MRVSGRRVSYLSLVALLRNARLLSVTPAHAAVTSYSRGTAVLNYLEEVCPAHVVLQSMSNKDLYFSI